MKIFNLPDLGEGIPEADIVEWHIQEGDCVTEDQVIVSVETAKAVVEVPSPITGTVARLCAVAGGTVLTGAPLVEFVSDQEDSGTVVGKLESQPESADSDDTFFIGTPPASKHSSKPIAHGSINDLAAKMGMTKGQLENSGKPTHSYQLENPEPLKGVRKHMARTMAESHAQVVPVTLFDEANIEHWTEDTDITVRLIQAICEACNKEPSLNALFDGSSLSRELFDSVNLGLAVDSGEGLFVPVIKEAEKLEAASLRQQINQFRTAVSDRSLPPSEMQGATITLSNFGVFSGQFATPVVVPPMVCIVGTGKLKNKVLAVDGNIVSHRVLPISMTFDHRAVTGGEATRFLKALLEDLSN